MRYFVFARYRTLLFLAEKCGFTLPSPLLLRCPAKLCLHLLCRILCRFLSPYQAAIPDDGSGDVFGRNGHAMLSRNLSATMVTGGKAEHGFPLLQNMLSSCEKGRNIPILAIEGSVIG